MGRTVVAEPDDVVPLFQTLTATTRIGTRRGHEDGL